MNELSFDVIQSQLTKKDRLLVTKETVKEIELLSKDPDYGEEFLDCYLTHLNILKDSPRASHQNYLNAVKFFSLVEADNSLVDAYIKVFPERYKARKRNNPESGKEIMNSEASRFNRSQLVNEIKKVALIPVQLIHRNLLHEAILETAKLMKTARSEMVRQKAAQTLITELKPTEDHTLQIKVDDGAKSAIEELRKATEALATEEYNSIQAGVSVQTIAERNIIEGDIEDAEFTEPEEGAALNGNGS
jgi:hypothetical protein